MATRTKTRTVPTGWDTTTGSGGHGSDHKDCRTGAAVAPATNHEGVTQDNTSGEDGGAFDRLPLDTILCGDALTCLRRLPADSVHCVVTSPPYWGLRDYGTGRWEGGDAGCDHRHETAHQKQGANSARIGRGNVEAQRNENFRDVCGKCGARLEPTLDAWVARMVEVFREVRRVLRPDGTLWLNLGDSYNAGTDATRKRGTGDVGYWQDAGQMGDLRRNIAGLKPKDLCGQPWRVAFALQADGWYLRSDIVWHKPNPMPESVTDRPTKSHEYVFLLTKQERYYYDAEAIREPLTDSSVARLSQPTFAQQTGGTKDYANGTNPNRSARKAVNNLREKFVRAEKWQTRYEGWAERDPGVGRNKRDVWTIATEPYPGAHFATFPTALVEPCVLAGSSPRVCEQCGAPWRRVSERDEIAPGNSRKYGQLAREARQTFLTGHAMQAWLDAHPKQTTGWRPTCRCEGASGSGRAIVLDPFAGTATALYVAKQLGRHYLGIELNPKYVKLAHKRLGSIPFPLWPADAMASE
jgi:DNA modification methylase